MLREQDSRKVLWVADIEGNIGKSYLANFLCTIHNYVLLDGTMKVRDVALFLNRNTKGICFDIARDSMPLFEYSVVESLKNGYITSGKYGGKKCYFGSAKIVVFSNQRPDYAKLSQDRWDVHIVGEGRLTNISKIACMDTKVEFPFSEPPPLPDLSEDFKIRDYLCTHMPRYANNVEQPEASDGNTDRQPEAGDGIADQQSEEGNTDANQQQPAGISEGYTNHTSQTAGPSRAAEDIAEPYNPACPLHPDSGEY